MYFSTLPSKNVVLLFPQHYYKKISELSFHLAAIYFSIAISLFSGMSTFHFSFQPVLELLSPRGLSAHNLSPMPRVRILLKDRKD